MGIPIEIAIKTEELLHLTGAMHKAIAELDRLINRDVNNIVVTVQKSELERIRTNLNSSLVQTYGF